MKLNCKYISASEAGDYYQVLFEEEEDSNKNYFLIQRGFKLDNEKLEPCYIESTADEFRGHLKINRVEFSCNIFYIQLANSKKSETEILFDTSDENYNEVKRVLNIFISLILARGLFHITYGGLIYKMKMIIYLLSWH